MTRPRHMLPALLLSLLIGPASAAPPTTQLTGRILCQYWRQIPGQTVADLLGAAAYPAYPTDQTYLPGFEIPPNQEPNFGTVVRGWVIGPQTGQYTFRIAGDNQCELWLSTDDQPAHMVRVACVPEWSLPRTWDQDPQQRSQPIRLRGGKRYYIEARHKDGGGDNSLAVAWTLPDGTMEAPIPGPRLEAAPAITVPPAQVVSCSELPTTPGNHRLQVTVDYLGQRRVVRVLVTLPRKTKPPYPVLIYCTDPPQASTAVDHQGPGRFLAAELADWSPLLALAVEPPPAETWDGSATAPAAAAALEYLLAAFSTDPTRIYLTGSEGTAIWRLSVAMPARFAAIVPFCAWEFTDVNLPASITGSHVLLITGTGNGMATDRSNRMHDRLEHTIDPPPQIDYETDKGTEVAADFYRRREFYESLLTWRRPAGGAAEQATAPPPKKYGLAGWRWPVLGGLAAVAAGLYLHRSRRRASGSRPV